MMQFNKLDNDTASIFDEPRAYPSDVETKEIPHKLQDKLKEIELLSENWDSYDAKTISPAVIKHMEALLERIYKDLKFRSSLPEPFICPLPDGGIQLELTTQSRHLEIEFTEQLEIFYLKKDLNTKSINVNDLPLQSEDEIIDLIKWILNSL